MGEQQLIAERYLVTRAIGKGASGTVFLCNDTKAGNLPVALKIFSPKLLQNELAKKRVVREISSSIQIDSNHVVKAYSTICNDQTTGLVMEYVKGIELKELIEKKEQTLGQKLEIMSQITAGLEAIHDEGIIHRDLKPANIIITDYGFVKIADLGISSLVNLSLEKTHAPSMGLLNIGEDSISTKTGDFICTPAYTSPEYIEYGIFDKLTDIYSLGTIFYELVTESFPFKYENIHELLRMKVEEQPIPIDGDLPDALKKLIDKMLKKDPRERIQTANEIKKQLQTIKDSERRSSKLIIDCDSIVTQDTETPESNKVTSISAGSSRQSFSLFLFFLIGVASVIVSTTDYLSFDLQLREEKIQKDPLAHKKDELLTEKNNEKFFGPKRSNSPVIIVKD